VRDVDVQYYGEPLREEFCANCDKHVMTHEKLYYLRFYGNVCEDCRDEIEEED
jgi:hypothetical protein